MPEYDTDTGTQVGTRTRARAIATDFSAAALSVSQAFLNNITIPSLQAKIPDLSNLPSGLQVALEDMQYNGPGLVGKGIASQAEQLDQISIAENILFNSNLHEDPGLELRNIARAIFAIGGVPTLDGNHVV